jgi:hypothetical protein
MPFIGIVIFMRSRIFSTFVISCLIVIATWLFPPPAWALVQIKLSELGYQECPAELSRGAIASGSSMAAHCFTITGKAHNSSSKTIYDADIYGRIYDANHNNVMVNRSRLGLIEEIPPGVSDFQIPVYVPAILPTPLQLENFKASGFTGRVRR